MGAGVEREMKLGEEPIESLELSKAWVMVSSPDLDTGGGVRIQLESLGNLGFFLGPCFNFNFLFLVMLRRTPNKANINEYSLNGEAKGDCKASSTMLITADILWLLMIEEIKLKTVMIVKTG